MIDHIPPEVTMLLMFLIALFAVNFKGTCQCIRFVFLLLIAAIITVFMGLFILCTDGWKEAKREIGELLGDDLGEIVKDIWRHAGR